jgi:hypothetical protein
MQPDHPRANAELMPLERPFVSAIPKLRKIVKEKGLTGLANDTKWNALLQIMRIKDQTGWTPSFRFRSIDSGYISSWDGEWWHHLPFPFISVLWFDLTYNEEIYVARLLPSKVVDHSIEVAETLEKIGFDFVKGSASFRIFGYAPRDYSDFKE